jgi:hypothetical protein
MNFGDIYHFVYRQKIELSFDISPYDYIKISFDNLELVVGIDKTKNNLREV